MSDSEIPLTNRRLRIGFLHRFDARNIRTWSGTFFFMCQALESRVGDIVYLGPDKSFKTRFIENNTYRLNRVWEKLTGEILITDKNRILASRLARFFEKRIQESPCDILFAPIAAAEIALIKTKLPIVYFSDITWNTILDYYPDYSKVSRLARAEGSFIETLAVQKSAACVFPSDWAARNCCSEFGSPRESTFTIGFGANINDPPTRTAALNRSLSGPINLLLMGVNWERKGGPIAFECLMNLLKNGVDASLTICGCVPPPGYEHDRFHVIPFLSKHDPEQRKQIAQLFLNANFMLLPTRADATPVVTCEASAFGLPTIATDTGGVGGAIRDGVNGFLMPYEARGDAYAAKIMQIIADPERYHSLVVSTRDEYERNLNWDAWGRSMGTVMEWVLNRNSSSLGKSGSRGENESVQM
jgi:glycosyltransferase involved in cell wall biosynthesis